MAALKAEIVKAKVDAQAREGRLKVNVDRLQQQVKVRPCCHCCCPRPAPACSLAALRDRT